MADKAFLQCRLRRGAKEQTTWIEARGAKAGSSVELLPQRELWEVVEVFYPPMSEAMLKDHQRMNRRSLPSIEAMA